jgi:hypothetical protein
MDVGERAEHRDAATIETYDTNLDDADSETSDAGRDGSTPSLARCRDTLRSMFSESAIDTPDRKSDAYRPPGEMSRAALSRSIADAVDGSMRQAEQHARRADYRLCRTMLRGASVAVWRPSEPTRGRARWALRLDDEAAPLVVEAPHPFYDLETRRESIAIFERVGARALLVAGTHRCANTDASNCSGRTGTCTESDDEIRYRTSDMAHNVETGFQAAHVAITDQFVTSIAVSVHGFTLDGISLSDGTRDPTDTDAPVARLATALSRHLSGVRVTSCNDYDGADHRERYCGTTNVQGRQLNGVSNLCTSFAREASERFIHFEQNRRIREQHVDRVVDAFDEVFRDDG